MMRRVLRGAGGGVGLAMLYSIYAVVVAHTSGPQAFAKDGVTLETVVLTYLAGGIVGGAIVGALFPLRRSFVGAVVVGFVAVVPFIMGIFYSMTGVPTRWQSSDWLGVFVISAAFGVCLGRMLRKTAR
jgi:hypothetical protein